MKIEKKSINKFSKYANRKENNSEIFRKSKQKRNELRQLQNVKIEKNSINKFKKQKHRKEIN